MLTDLKNQKRELAAAETASETIPAEVLILAAGHSARDTFEMLLHRGIAMEAKPFSVGVRVEHCKPTLTAGCMASLPDIPRCRSENISSHRVGERAFIPSVCVREAWLCRPPRAGDGSYQRHELLRARRCKRQRCGSCFCDAFGLWDSPLDGMQFQRRLEHLAWQAGESPVRRPAQDVGHFLDGKPGLTVGKVRPTYPLGVHPAILMRVCLLLWRIC
jgi:uncharacterized FAD-dependent dehydrogenase